jgi:hypothetical protein
MRLKWLNNPGGKPQTPCDPGLCKIFPEAKTAAKAWAQGLRQPPDYHDRHFCECLRPRNPSLLSHLPRKRHYRFHPRRSYAQRSLTSEYHLKLSSPHSLRGPMVQYARTYEHVDKWVAGINPAMTKWGLPHPGCWPSEFADNMFQPIIYHLR